eukprot:g11322.t1
MGGLTEKKMQALISVMWKENVLPGRRLIRESDLGADFFYVVESGTFEVIITEKLAEARAGAIVHSKKTVVDASVWVCDRLQFKSIVMPVSEEKQLEFVQIFSAVTYNADEHIVEQGAPGNTFFMLVEGKVVILRDDMVKGELEANVAKQTIPYFGERALLYQEPRAATVKVISESARCLMLDKEIQLSGKTRGSSLVITRNTVGPDDYPEALEVAKNYSSQGNRPNMEVEMAWKGALKQFFQTRAFTDIVLKDKYEFDSPLDPELWEAWLKTAADPEQHLVEWIRKGVPLGMSKEIPCCGIFPMSDDPEQEVEETPELANQLGMENYKSFTDEPEHAKAELGRLVAEGFAVVLPTNKASAMHQRGTVSKLALLVKAKEDGTVKRRIIIDLLRSGGNARCKVPERIVLPRVMDVVDSFRYLWKTRDRMPIKARDEEWELDEDRPEGGIYDFEMVTADLSDAYCHLPVHPDEHHNCLSPGIYPSETLMWVAMLFGFRGAPLLMGRFAACLARIWQSLIAPSEMQSQLYMDDPMWILRGPTSRRNRNLALLLYTARALGINLAWHKGSRGSQLTWIGVMFEVMQAEAEVKLTVPRKMMEEIRGSLESWESKGMISLREVQQVTGRLSWVAGILPRTRWAVSIMYAVIADVKRAEEDERRRASQRSDTRPKHGLVSVKRLELPRRWFMVFFKDPGVLALRTEPMEERPPDFAIVTDASPQGIGAVLATVDHNVGQTFTILEALEIPVLEEDAKWLGVEWKESSSQGPLEAWAVKLAFRRWGNRLEGKSVILRSDSVVALAMTKRLSSPSPVINWIGAELAIRHQWPSDSVAICLRGHLPYLGGKRCLRRPSSAKTAKAMSGSPSWTLPLALALGIATVAVFSLRKRRSTCSEEQRGVVLTALKELARRFFPVCQDLASIAKTVRTKMKATHVLIPEETLQEQLLRQCQVFEKLQHIQHEVAEEYGISEEELQSLQEATQDEEVQSYTAGFRSMLDEALQGSSPVLPNAWAPNGGQ